MTLTLTFEKAETLEIEVEVMVHDAREYSHAGHRH